jgi:hypothetical protein
MGPTSGIPCAQDDYLARLAFSSSSSVLSSQDSDSEAPGSPSFQGSRVSGVEQSSSSTLPSPTPYAPIGVRPPRVASQAQQRRYEHEVGEEGESRVSTPLLGEGYAEI